jgi:hypothetical protein
VCQLWSNYEEPKEEVVVEEPVERKINYSKVVITEVTDQFSFYAQKYENGMSLTLPLLSHLDEGGLVGLGDLWRERVRATILNSSPSCFLV